MWVLINTTECSTVPYNGTSKVSLLGSETLSGFVVHGPVVVM